LSNVGVATVNVDGWTAKKSIKTTLKNNKRYENVKLFEIYGVGGVNFCALCPNCVFIARRPASGTATKPTRQNFDAGLFFSPNSLILIRRKSTPPTVEAPGGFSRERPLNERNENADERKRR
jgi:hypothetical protein